jgi:hypothetical protein
MSYMLLRKINICRMFLISNVTNPEGTIRIFQTYQLYWHAKFSFTRMFFDSYHVDSKNMVK